MAAQSQFAAGPGNPDQIPVYAGGQDPGLFHFDPNCPLLSGGGSIYPLSLSEALRSGMVGCQVCGPGGQQMSMSPGGGAPGRMQMPMPPGAGAPGFPMQ
jgi:hypothetical protein